MSENSAHNLESFLHGMVQVSVAHEALAVTQLNPAAQDKLERVLTSYRAIAQEVGEAAVTGAVVLLEPHEADYKTDTITSLRLVEQDHSHPSLTRSAARSLLEILDVA